MSRRARLTVQVVICVIALAVPGQLARHLGLPEAAPVLSLASLAALVAAMRVGWQQALGGSVALALASIPAVLSQSNTPGATALMAVTAVLLGLASRWQQQPAYWFLVVSLCMLITSTPLPQPVTAALLAKLAGLPEVHLGRLLASWHEGESDLAPALIESSGQAFRLAAAPYSPEHNFIVDAGKTRLEGRRNGRRRRKTGRPE